MAQVQTFAIDNAGPYDVVTKSSCRRVLVQENYNSANPPTADLQQFGPNGEGPIAVAKGTPAVFSSQGGVPIAPGTKVGRINTTAGSITVQQIEGDTI